MEGVQPTPPPASTNAAMVKLWCILDTGFEVFGVEVPLTADVDTLKERIKAKNPTDLRDIDARHLRLVKVTNANDGTPVSFNALDGNARRQVADAIHAAVKGGRNVEDGTFKPVENASLKSRVMTPAPTATIAHYRFKPPPPPPAISPEDMADDDDFVPQQFVHILVVLPEATTATQAGSSNPGLIDAIAHRVVEAISDQEQATAAAAFQQAVSYFRFRGTVDNAKRAMGIRKSVYTAAMRAKAFYDNSPSQSIYYVDNSPALQLSIIFKNEDHALDFRNFVLEAAAEVHRILGGIKVEHEIVPVLSKDVILGDAILSSHYSPADSESPALSDEQLSNWSSAASLAEFNSDLMRFQSLESVRFYGSLAGESCHIIPHASCKGSWQKYDKNDNNRLSLTRDFHAHFDGLGARGIPTITIYVHSYSAVRNQDGRYAVQLRIYFSTEEIRMILASRLKDGSCVVDGRDRTYSTVVYVKDYEEFRKCVGWKFYETEDKWRAANVTLTGVSNPEGQQSD